MDPVGQEAVPPVEERRSVESEFADLIRYSELYLRQKVDLYIQSYLIDPVNFILKQIVYVVLLLSLLVTGILAISIGAILFISTILPAWAALLIVGIVLVVIGIVVTYVMFTNKILLKTPKAEEVAARDNITAESS